MNTSRLNKKYLLSKYVNNNSPLVFGCMGLGGSWEQKTIDAQGIKQANLAIDAALEAGITVFDHADIYSLSKAEQVFGEVLKSRPELRSKMAIQSKCAIRFADDIGPKRYDCSPEWITSSVNNTLTRLGIEQLDILMLHRPDPLMEPELIAEVFDTLHTSGKVKDFGVSNMQSHQISFLQSSLTQPLIVNQIELSLGHLAWLEEGVTSGASGHGASNFAAGTLEYCQQKNIQLQAWGCLSQGLFTGNNGDKKQPYVQKTTELVAKLAAEYQVSNEAIVLAWLMFHPANIQPVIGTTNLKRIKACAEFSKVNLSREHWYALYESARGTELP
jgi:predicted oxidoreductase